MKMVDHEEFSFWFIHYEKFGEEGTNTWKFSNLLLGFKHGLEQSQLLSFGTVCMVGKEPNLEIKGVLLTHGHQIPQKWHDTPMFEHMRPRKIDCANPADVNLIREYFAAKEGLLVDGLPC